MEGNLIHDAGNVQWMQSVSPRREVVVEDAGDVKPESWIGAQIAESDNTTSDYWTTANTEET